MMRFTEASESTVRAWKSWRRARRAWLVMTGFARVVQVVLSVLLDAPDADLPPATPRGSAMGESEGTPARVPAGLIVHRLRGWPIEREQHVAHSLPVRLRGPSAMVTG